MTEPIDFDQEARNLFAQAWNRKDLNTEAILERFSKALEYTYKRGLQESATAPIPARWKLVPLEPTQEMLAAGRPHTEGDYSLPYSLYTNMLAAAPAPIPAGWAFTNGQRVRKKSGSWWEGKVVGTYSTTQTPEGYCVQLEQPNGPVQIYPESALEAVPPEAP